MSLDSQLQTNYQQLTALGAQQRKLGVESMPMVLEHFTEFVNQTINQKLPKDNQLVVDPGVSFFSVGKYRVATGGILTPDEELKICTPQMGRFLDHQLDQYLKIAPWVDKVIRGYRVEH